MLVYSSCVAILTCFINSGIGTKIILWEQQNSWVELLCMLVVAAEWFMKAEE